MKELVYCEFEFVVSGMYNTTQLDETTCYQDEAIENCLAKDIKNLTDVDCSAFKHTGETADGKPIYSAFIAGLHTVKFEKKFENPVVEAPLYAEELMWQKIDRKEFGELNGGHFDCADKSISRVREREYTHNLKRDDGREKEKGEYDDGVWVKAKEKKKEKDKEKVMEY